MAQFYGSINGQAKTQATRRGSKNSGMSAHIRGWNVGVYVVCSHVGGKDIIRVYKTGGSNQGINQGINAPLVAEFTE